MNIDVNNVWQLEQAFYNAWLDCRDVKLTIPSSLRNHFEELLDEAEEIEINHIDWEFV